MKRPLVRFEILMRLLTMRRLQVFILITAAAVFSYAIGNRSSAAELGAETTPEPQDFSKFDHRTAQHTRLPCLVCHVRNDNSAAIRFPGHIPCSSCHAQQFADNQSPICTICHTATGLKNFPGLRSFSATFNHARHTNQTNCATCHKSIRGGVALSVPSGANAHQTCFACHTARNEIGGRNIGSCNVCHQPGRPIRNTTSARAFNVNFNHNEHTRQNLSCNACHTVRAGTAHGRQVSAPMASMHFAPANAQSCASCHNNRRAFGGVDFTDCKKCHEQNSFRFRR